MRSVTQILSAGLRLSTLGVKYLFLVAMLRVYPLDTVGHFNVVTGYCSLLVYLVGLEFYYVANRQTPLLDKAGKGKLLVHQLLLYGMMYLLVGLPLLAFLPAKFSLGGLFLALLIASHLNIEVFRALNSVKRATLGAVVFSLGNGLWTIPLLAMFALGLKPSVSQILTINTGCAVVSVLLGFWALRREVEFPATHFGLDAGLLKTGLAVALPVMASTLSYRGSELLGRFMLEGSSGLAAAGAFSSFQTLASAVLIFVEAGVTTVAIPYLLEARARSMHEFDILSRKLLRQVFCVSAAATLLLVVSAKPFFLLIGKEELVPELGAFYVTTVAYMLMALAAYYATDLYVRQKDRMVVLINLGSAALGAVLTYLLVFRGASGLFGASLALLIWSILQLAAKWMAVRSQPVADGQPKCPILNQG